jgi:uncharacterized membrane protein YgdD (TMEM256/DUF423 family)
MPAASKQTFGLISGLVSAVVLGAFTVYLIRGTEGVHLPLLSGGLAGILIGFLSPQRGWIPALLQAIVLGIGVLVFSGSSPVREIELHSLIGAVGLTFAGSFIGAFVKRAFDS